jgi:hypothetical protein
MLLCCTAVLAASPKAKPFHIDCGGTSVRIMPAKSWTPDIIRQNGKIIAQHNGFSGLVADIKGKNSWIGSGHSEGGREKVLSFKLYIDGKQTPVPVNGKTIRCARAETVKESRLDNLSLVSKVIITPRKITEIHDLKALSNMKVHKLYGFLHCWTNQSTDWISENRDGKIIKGKFTNFGGFRLLGDARWAAEFIPKAKTLIFTEFPATLPKGEGRKHCIWDIRNYHKQYYQAMADKHLQKGDSFRYEMTTRLLPATKNNWSEVAKSAAKGSSTTVAASANPDFFFVNLKNVVNMGFADERADDRQGGWTDQGPNNDLNSFKTGIKTLKNIPFDIINPAQNNGKACLVLRNKYKTYFPVESSSISIDRKVQAFYLLMGCAWSGQYGKNIAHFIVRYKNSSFYSEIPVAYGKHVGGWWNPRPVSVGEIAWKASNGSSDIGVYSFGWVNPYPEQEVRDIQLVSAGQGGMPILLAVTGIKPSAFGRKLTETIKKKEYKAATAGKAPDKVDISVDFNRKLKHSTSYSIAFGIGGNCLTPLYRKAAVNIMKAGTGPVVFRYQVSTGVGKAEPAPAEGVWDFKKLDFTVDYIKSLGAVPMLCFGPGGPIWMAKKNNVYGDAKRYWRPESITEYTEYCRKIVQRYHSKGIPVMWEIGNEVELKRWPASYYLKVFGKVARAIKRVSRNLQTGGPATCNPNLGWAREMLANYASLVDFVTYHEYGYSETFDSPDSFIMSKTDKYETSAREYRELISKYIPDRNVPLFVTEANINWRWQGGTDPRIRNMAGAAWYASAQGRFWRGGGDALCYFTFGGGFGCCYKSLHGLVLTPTYHAIWLYRKLGRGTMTHTKSNSETVEAYAFANNKANNVLLVNKNNSSVKVTLKLNRNGKNALVYTLNEQSLKDLKHLSDGGDVPQLKPEKITSGSQINFVMKPFEVRGISFR